MGHVVVIGSATIDQQFRERECFSEQLGGVATYATVTFLREGVDSITVCNLGGEKEVQVRNLMRKLGMKVYSGHTERMTCFRNHLTPDGARHQELLAVSESIASTTIRPALNGSMLIHLGPVHPEDIHHDAIRDLTDVPGKVSLDVQGYLRTGYLGNVRASVSESLEKALSRSSFIKADHSEMALILKHFGCNVQDLASRFDIEEIIVTCGSEGGYVVSENGIQVNYDAVQVDKLVDTTGAGDVFFSAYMTERLFRQKSIKQATQFAARRAAMQVSGMFIHSEDLNIGSA